MSTANCELCFEVTDFYSLNMHHFILIIIINYNTPFHKLNPDKQEYMEILLCGRRHAVKEGKKEKKKLLNATQCALHAASQ